MNDMAYRRLEPPRLVKLKNALVEICTPFARRVLSPFRMSEAGRIRPAVFVRLAHAPQ
jgi:hypothetical protein